LKRCATVVDVALSTDKQRVIAREFGASGERWIERYPSLIEKCVTRWDLELTGRATAGLPINVIFFARLKGEEEVVLKIGHPHPEQKTEMITLPWYEGRFAPRLIDCDADLGATLMERVLPGTTFRQSAQDISRSRESLLLFSEISVQVNTVPGLPDFSEWIERAFEQFRQQFDNSHPLAPHVDLAESTWGVICDEYPERFLLHGDLHHENILRDDEMGWRAIDPKGVIGPRVMEAGRYLHNFMEDEVDGVDDLPDATVDQLCEVLAARYEALSGVMGESVEWLGRAAYVDCVLSHCWTINDGDSIAYGRIESTRRMLED
jgi:streptomycin 6-kinase